MIKRTTWIFSLVFLVLMGCSEHFKTQDPDEKKETSATSAYNRPVGTQAQSASVGSAEGHAQSSLNYLDQNWDYDTRMEWWYTPQGSWVMPYDWFLALERPGSQELIRSKVNLDRYRFIAWPPERTWNPDGLPIGLVAEKDAKTGRRYFGFTCAACHTGKITYEGKQYIVEGGPALHDFDRFVTELVDAMKVTLEDEAKFTRFADRVLGNDPTSVDKAALREELVKESTRQGKRVRLNRPPNPNGYARLDAFGNIFNEVAVFSINEPSNAKPSNAPVSYPVLWDTPHHDVVQWNGAAVNAGIGPFTRNVGEVVGVFGDLRIKEVKSLGKNKLRYESHINIENLERLEAILTSLWSPEWPEGELPAIDKSKAKRGERLYDKSCSGCHQFSAQRICTQSVGVTAKARAAHH